MKINPRIRGGIVVVLLFIAVIYLVPSSGVSLPEWWQKVLPTDKVHLGLDLQGGMHLVLNVEAEKAVEGHVEHAIAGIKADLRDEGVEYTNVSLLDSKGLVVSLLSRDDYDDVVEKLKEYVDFEIETFGPESDQNEIILRLRESERKRIMEAAVDQGLETIRNRVDQFGVTEPTIQRHGKREILVQLPGIKDPQRAIKLIGKTALLELKLVDEENSVEEALKGSIPEGDLILYGKPVRDEITGKLERRPYLLKKETALTGNALSDALVKIDSRFGQPYVSLDFNKMGGETFARITEENVNRRLAIVLDDTVYSAPVIKEKISGGKAQITGSFTAEEAHDLAIVLRAGSLPAPVKILEKRTVGPTLGRDSIRYGIISITVGIILVVLFIVVYYKMAGIIANFALLVNLYLLLATLAAFKATLTLPGIAGIVLTIGMSIDANVLIFERIREELALGKTVRAAIDTGYSRAFRTILDANVTTLITAIVLFQFGTGPIKGFAVTLSIGIVASMFTAIFMTRVIFDLWTSARGKIEVLSI